MNPIMFCLGHVSPNLSSNPCSAEFVDNFGFLIWFEFRFIFLCLLILWCILLLVWVHICMLVPYKFIYIYSIVFLKFLILFLNSRIRTPLFFKFCTGCFLLWILNTLEKILKIWIYTIWCVIKSRKKKNQMKRQNREKMINKIKKECILAPKYTVVGQWFWKIYHN